MNSKEDLTPPIPDPPDPIDWKEAARLYREEGLSYTEIARVLGFHRQSIRACLLAHGVPRRGPSPCIRSRWGNKLYVHLEGHEVTKHP